MFTKEGASSYFLGTTRIGGWWYFFFVDLALKSPLPFLILSVIGFVALARFVREKKWTPLAPGVSALAILLATTTVKVYYGIRHVIVLFPLLAIVAGCGAAWLWQRPGNRRIWGRLLLAGLLLWQCISTVAARHDYIAYFNELAGRDPSRIFVAGCDLDCGQDLFRLSQVAHARNISRISHRHLVERRPDPVRPAGGDHPATVRTHPRLVRHQPQGAANRRFSSHQLPSRRFRLARSISTGGAGGEDDTALLHSGKWQSGSCA